MEALLFKKKGHKTSIFPVLQNLTHMGKFSHFSPLLGPGGEYYNHLGDS